MKISPKEYRNYVHAKNYAFVTRKPGVKDTRVMCVVKGVSGGCFSLCNDTFNIVRHPQCTLGMNSAMSVLATRITCRSCSLVLLFVE